MYTYVKKKHQQLHILTIRIHKSVSSSIFTNLGTYGIPDST